MATLSSHLLNSVNGTHASGVKVIVNQISSSGSKKIFYETETDQAGRILKNNEFIEVEKCKIIVESSDKRRIKTLKVISQLMTTFAITP